MDFHKEVNMVEKGNLEKIIENRIEGTIYCPEKYGPIEVILTTKKENENNSWHRDIKVPLKFNPVLLNLINCYSIILRQDFFIVDGKLITKFCSNKYISQFFSFEEEHIYEQDGENIKVTRYSDGKNKMGEWLFYPLTLMLSSYMKETEDSFQEQMNEFIISEIQNS